MEKMFCEGLKENDISKLLMSPKSDLHNHSTKGCTRAWIEKKISRKLVAPPPQKFYGLEGMQKWFTKEIKPYCCDTEGIVLRWEGAFAKAQRNTIKRLSMSFGTEAIELVGGMPELTYRSRCNVDMEVSRIEQYISDGFFKSIDVCGGENIQSFEAYLPLYRKAEQ